MTNETMDAPRQAPPRTYPPLDAAQMTNINAKLVTIAALRYPGELTTAQLAKPSLRPLNNRLAISKPCIVFRSGTQTSPPSSARRWDDCPDERQRHRLPHHSRTRRETARRRRYRLLILQSSA